MNNINDLESALDSVVYFHNKEVEDLQDVAESLRDDRDSFRNQLDDALFTISELEDELALLRRQLEDGLPC